MRFHTLIIAAALTCAMLPGMAQDTLRLTLPRTIERARLRSVNAEASLAKLKSAYWQYRTYRADLLPEVDFKATMPAYYRQYNSYQDAQGNYGFVPDHHLGLRGELSVSQNIWFTGGKLSLTTSLDYLRQYGSGGGNRFMSIPVALTLDQPVLGVNNVKWNRRIEPVRYAEAQAEFLSATEDVAITAVNYYFNLLLARENVDISRQNRDNAAKLYEVAKEKRSMGRISGNDLLQMELNLINAESSLTANETEMRNASFRLSTFLDYDGALVIDPEVPDVLPECNVDYSEALDKALANNKFAKSMIRRQLEANYDVAKAKGDLRSINVFAQVGLTGMGGNVGNAYNPLKNNQVVEVGVDIPLLDWGKRRGKVKVAQSNLRYVDSQLRQESQEFSQNLYILVERFNNQRRQLDLALRADTIAAKRYQTNVETFMIGMISTLDLNDSQSSKDDSRREFLNELYLYWSYYYQLRSITLWDYARDCNIEADIEHIVKND